VERKCEAEEHDAQRKRETEESEAKRKREAEDRQCQAEERDMQSKRKGEVRQHKEEEHKAQHKRKEWKLKLADIHRQRDLLNPLKALRMCHSKNAGEPIEYLRCLPLPCFNKFVLTQKNFNCFVRCKTIPTLLCKDRR